MLDEAYIKSTLQYDPETGVVHKKSDKDCCQCGYTDKDGYVRKELELQEIALAVLTTSPVKLSVPEKSPTSP